MHGVIDDDAALSAFVKIAGAMKKPAPTGPAPFSL
jgi:hypothetical protein